MLLHFGFIFISPHLCGVLVLFFVLALQVRGNSVGRCFLVRQDSGRATLPAAEPPPYRKRATVPRHASCRAQPPAAGPLQEPPCPCSPLSGPAPRGRPVPGMLSAGPSPSRQAGRRNRHAFQPCRAQPPAAGPLQDFGLSGPSRHCATWQTANGGTVIVPYRCQVFPYWQR